MRLVAHLGGGSAAGALVTGGLEGAGRWGPLSCGGGAAVPHLGSASEGSTTYTAPSPIPNAIWLGSDGCAAITVG